MNLLYKLNIVFVFTLMLWLCAIPVVQNQIGMSPNFDTELCEEESSNSTRVLEEEPHKLFCQLVHHEAVLIATTRKGSFQDGITTKKIQPAFKVTVPPPECECCFLVNLQ